MRFWSNNLSIVDGSSSEPSEAIVIDADDELQVIPKPGGQGVESTNTTTSSSKTQAPIQTQPRNVTPFV